MTRTLNFLKSGKDKTNSMSKYISVDIWQIEFSPISQKAVYSIYARNNGVEYNEALKIGFTKCVESLRANEKISEEGKELRDQRLKDFVERMDRVSCLGKASDKINLK